MGFSLHSNDFQSMYSTYGFLTHSILSFYFFCHLVLGSLYSFVFRFSDFVFEIYLSFVIYDLELFYSLACHYPILNYFGGLK